MKYKVAYETTEKPTNLPEGATVVRVSSLPVTVKTNIYRTIRITEDGLKLEDNDLGDSIYARLTDAEKIEIANALLESAGQIPEETEKVSLPVEVMSVHGKTIRVLSQTDSIGVNITREDGTRGIGFNLDKENRRKLGNALLSGL